MQHEPFGTDRGGAVNHPRRHMALKARVARRARHRQAMGQEIPVLGDDIEQAQRWLRAPISGVLGRAGAQQIVDMHDPGRPASTTNSAVILVELSTSSASLTS